MLATGSESQPGKPSAHCRTKELEVLELKTKTRGPEDGQVEVGRGGREIRGAEPTEFKTNAQRQPKLQQPVCMGLLIRYAGDQPALTVKALDGYQVPSRTNRLRNEE